MSKKNIHHYTDIEQIVIVAKFKDGDDLYQFHVNKDDTGYFVNLMASLKCPITKEPLEMMKFVEPDESHRNALPEMVEVDHA